MAICRYTKKSKEMGRGMKLSKKDFGKWDKEELSLIVKGYTARQIANHILDNQKIVKKFKDYYESNHNTMSLGVRITFEEILGYFFND